MMKTLHIVTALQMLLILIRNQPMVNGNSVDYVDNFYLGQSYCGACLSACENLTITLKFDANRVETAIYLGTTTDTGFEQLWFDILFNAADGDGRVYRNEICPDECYMLAVQDAGDDGLTGDGFVKLQEDNGNSACSDGSAFGGGNYLDNLVPATDDPDDASDYYDTLPLFLFSSGCDPSATVNNPPCPVTDSPSDSPSDAPSDSPTEAPSETQIDAPSEPTNSPTTGQPDYGLECFSSEMEVIVQDKGPVKMEMLEVGDFIKVGTDNTYEQVYAFAHRVPQMHTEFLQLHTTAGAPLEVTAGHLVFVNGKTNPIRADAIKVGDCLQAESSNAVVEKITFVSRNGIYNPLTRTGTIQVNGITASTFISFQKKNNEYVELERGIGPLLSHHDFAHRAIAPYWFYCTTFVSCGEVKNGLPVYVSKGMNLIEWSQQQHILLQILMWTFFRILLLASIMIISMIVMIPSCFISSISTFHLQKFFSSAGTTAVNPTNEM